MATMRSARITGIASEMLRSAINELPKAIRKAKIAAIHHSGFTPAEDEKKCNQRCQNCIEESKEKSGTGEI